MRRLRAALLEANLNQTDRIIRVVESVLEDSLQRLNDQASVNCEKHEGASELVHYYAGEGMGYRALAEDLGLIIEWRNAHAESRYLEDLND